MDELLAQFLIEGRELVVEAHGHLDAARTAPNDPAAIDGAFRAFHTLKGSVGLFDMAPAGRILHAGEDLLEQARSGKKALDDPGLAALVDCIDHVDRWIDALEQTGRLPDGAAAAASRLEARLRGTSSTRMLPAETLPSGDWLQPLLADATTIIERSEGPLLAFRYEPDAGCFFRGDDPLRIASALPGLVALRVSPRQAWPGLDALSPFECALLIEGLSSASHEAMREAFRSVGDQVAILAVPAPERAPAAAAASGTRTLRIDEARIDALAGDVGELVLVANMLAHLTADAARVDDALGTRLRHVQSGLERGLASLRRNVTAARMVPLAPTFRRLPRMAREIAAGLGLDIALTVEGGATEVDKAIADMLFEPLLHLLRNAIDHGIEPPERRRAAGKAERGDIRLSASRTGNRVTIALADDGAGIDPDRIRAVAVERGVLSAEAAGALGDEAALLLVFAPGFTTASRTTDLSGRGVGMDAVKAAVEAAGGTVTIESDPGRGTTTSLHLPLSAITTRLLLVRVGADRYGIPFDAIVETAIVPDGGIHPVGQGHAFVLRDRAVPVMILADLLGLPATEAAKARLLVVEVNGDRVAIAVDGFGEQIEAVVRPPSRLLSAIPGIAGTTVLADGQVLLVIEPAGLLA